MGSSESVQIVIGATGGIGSALARRLVVGGAKLTLAARTRETLESLAAEIGGDAHPIDASSFEAVQELVDVLKPHLG